MCGRANVESFRGKYYLGESTNSEYAQRIGCLIDLVLRDSDATGPFLVSRNGNASCFESNVKVPKWRKMESERVLAHFDIRNVAMEVGIV